MTYIKTICVHFGHLRRCLFLRRNETFLRSFASFLCLCVVLRRFASKFWMCVIPCALFPNLRHFLARGADLIFCLNATNSQTTLLAKVKYKMKDDV